MKRLKLKEGLYQEIGITDRAFKWFRREKSSG